MGWRARAGKAVLVVGLVAGALWPLSPAAAADTAPTVTVTGSGSCSPGPGELTVYFTVSQGAGPPGSFVSVAASPISGVFGPGNDLTSATPAVFRIQLSTADAAWAKLSESFAATVAFDLASGTVNVNASATIALPLCPASLPPDADTYVQHCDRSVDAYVVYNPGYTAGSTTLTFSGRGYTGVGPYAPENTVVTVSPGQTAHAFFDADHAYSIQLSQDNNPSQFGDSPLFAGVPDGCPYIPPPGSPASLVAPPSAGGSPPGATQPGPGSGRVSAGQPGRSTTGGSVPLGTPVPSGGPPASAAASGASADPTLSVDSASTARTRLAAASTGSLGGWWFAIIGLALAGALAPILLAWRRRPHPAVPPVSPGPDDAG